MSRGKFKIYGWWQTTLGFIGIIVIACALAAIVDCQSSNPTSCDGEGFTGVVALAAMLIAAPAVFLFFAGITVLLKMRCAAVVNRIVFWVIFAVFAVLLVALLLEFAMTTVGGLSAGRGFDFLGGLAIAAYCGILFLLAAGIYLVPIWLFVNNPRGEDD